MNDIRVLVLAAGESTRFTKGTPKPVLRWADPPEAGVWPMMMWEHALSSIRQPMRKHLAMRRDHLIHLYNQKMENRCTDVIKLDTTDGQADTILQSLRYPTLANRDDGDILIINCDAGFAPGCLDALVAAGRQKQQDAALVFAAGVDEEKRWSWIDHPAAFRQAAEKRHLGVDLALAGAYYFTSREDLEIALDTAVSRTHGTGWEPYLSNAYEFMPRDAVPIIIDRSSWYDWGTQEKLDSYFRRSHDLPELSR